MLKPLLVAISFLLVSFVAKADVYVWRDAKGVLNYSDTPSPQGARNVGIFGVRKENRSGETAGRGTPRPGGGDAASGSGVRIGTSTSSGTTTGGGGASTTTPSPKPDFLEDFVGVTFPGGDNSYSSPFPPGTWFVQQKAHGRVSVIDAPGGVGGKCMSLRTEPGDVVSIGNHRADATLAMPGSLPGQPWQVEQTMAAGSFEGSERWYAHSVYFPSNGFNPPRSPNAWATFMNFHGHLAGWPQSLQLDMTRSDGFRFLGGGGAGGQARWSKFISPEPVRDRWYDFVYHIKWTSTKAGFIHIWMNGKLLHKQDNQPTLWDNDSAYLKLANYHTDENVASTVCHRRIRIGKTAESVALGPLEGVLTLVNGILTPLP